MNERLTKVAQSLELKGLDAVLIMRPTNIYYLTGFTGGAVYLLIGRESADLITDFKFTDQAKIECPDIRHHEYSVLNPYFAIIAGLGYETIGFEADYQTCSMADGLRSLMGFAEWKPYGADIADMRACKDEGELELMREAARISDRSFRQTLEYICAGRTEKQVATFLFQRMVENGADLHLSFDICVGSGVRSAISHCEASDKVIERGDMVVMDFGCRYQYYTTDCTRSVVIGRANEEQRTVYNHVLNAQQQVLDRMKAGMTNAQAHRIANEYFAAAGYSDVCGNALGHGIGLGLEDKLLLIDIVQFFGESPLLVNMVETVEPGIYLPERFGVRIEDDVIVGENGVEIITRAPKDLMEIG